MVGDQMAGDQMVGDQLVGDLQQPVDDLQQPVDAEVCRGSNPLDTHHAMLPTHQPPHDLPCLRLVPARDR